MENKPTMGGLRVAVSKGKVNTTKGVNNMLYIPLRWECEYYINIMHKGKCQYIIIRKCPNALPFLRFDGNLNNSISNNRI